jgi:hypothetical protein
MRLAEESHARLEQFFRWYERDERLRLPVVSIHAGLLSHGLTRVLRIAGITIGRHVFVSRESLKRDPLGQLTIHALLMVHEAAHIRQFQQAGLLPFISGYVWEYLTFLCRSGKFDAEARRVAYEQITREREARQAEAAYLEWRLNALSSSL